MNSIMEGFRNEYGAQKAIDEFAGRKITHTLDYARGIDGLPKSNVLKYILENNNSVIIRPSGTEPKIKVYTSVSAETKQQAQEVAKQLAEIVEKIFDTWCSKKAAFGRPFCGKW